MNCQVVFLLKLLHRIKPIRPCPILPADSFGVQSKRLITTEFSVFALCFRRKVYRICFLPRQPGKPLSYCRSHFHERISGFRSNYNYSKLLFSVSDYMKTPPFGNISYQVYAGKTFGTAPYTFLDVAPGNELYYYNKYAFNTMIRYQYVHDRFAGINYEHNIGNGIFKLVPKLKFRQFYTVKALWGSLSDANKSLTLKKAVTFSRWMVNIFRIGHRYR